MKRAAVVAAAALAFAGVSAAVGAQGADTAWAERARAGAERGVAERVDAYVRGQADSGFAGVVLVARATGGVVLHRAYGPHLTTRTPFWIASNSKQFTAAAILRLAEQGRLATTDPMGRFLPDAPPDKRAITIHQLLTHTAGFAGRDAAAGITDRDSAVRAILAVPLAYAPGNGYRYVNDDYVLLAAIVEVASGEPYERFVRAALLAPAGTTRTGFWGDGRDTTVAPLDTAAVRAAPPTAWRDGRTRANWGDRGATGIYSTADDLLRWLRALEADRVLAPEGRRLMFAPQALARHEGSRDVYYGYGWGVEQERGRTILLRHFGDEWFGHNSAMWLTAGGDTIVVLSNAGHQGGGARTWSSVVCRGVARLLAGGDSSVTTRQARTRR